jgi:hypothetical protein
VNEWLHSSRLFWRHWCRKLRTRDEALDHIASLMREWFEHDDWTAERLGEDLALIEEDEANAYDSLLWYPVFAMEVLTRARVVE